MLKSHHSVIYRDSEEPDLLEGEAPQHGEAGLLQFIQVKARVENDTMDRASRLNYGKMYTVEHNVRVYDFGMVVDKDIPILLAQWKQVLDLTFGQTSEHTEMASSAPYQEDNEVESVMTRTLPPAESSSSLTTGLTHLQNSQHANIFSAPQYRTHVDYLSTNSDVTSDLDSVFSGAESSTSSISALSMNSMQVMGVRAIATTLLGREDLAELFTTAITKVDQQKARARFRGLLRQFGQNLLKEAPGSALATQAAQFVRRLAGRISDQICWDLAGAIEMDRPPRTAYPVEDLEEWLAALDSVGSSKQMVSEAHHKRDGTEQDDEDTFSGADSDEEAPKDLQLPRIDMIRDFLMQSEAIDVLIGGLRGWLKVDDGVKDSVEKSTTSLAPQTSQKEISLAGESEAPDVEAEATVKRCPRSAPKSRRVIEMESSWARLVGLITQGIDSWANRYLTSYIPHVSWRSLPPGHVRISWRCISRA